MKTFKIIVVLILLAAIGIYGYVYVYPSYKLYKRGVACVARGHEVTAKYAFRCSIDKYPYSPVIFLAQKELKEIDKVQ